MFQEKWFLGIFIVIILLGLITGIWLFKQNSVQAEQHSNEQHSNKDLIKSAWLHLGKENKTWSQKQQECETSLTEQGLRSIYCDVKQILDYNKLKEVSQLNVFRQGPHSNELNLKADQFGYYNQDFVIWLQKNLVPAAKDPAFKQVTQPLYERYLSKTARAFYKTHQVLMAQSNYLEEEQNAYLQHLDDRTLPELYLQEQFRGLADDLEAQGYDWYSANSAAGFWLRRKIDGTEGDFFLLLEKLIKTYDPELGGTEGASLKQ